jgi:hypothetical protein
MAAILEGRAAWAVRPQFRKGTTQAKLGLSWFSDFRGKDLNVKVYN